METKQEHAKVTSKTLFEAAKYEIRNNKYPGKCRSCSCRHDEGDARIVRPIGGQQWGAQWILLCKDIKCTRKFLNDIKGSRWESNDSDHEI